MSEEKKTSWGKPYGASAPQEPQRAAAPAAADDASEPTIEPVKASSEDAAAPSGRGKNQQVLQGILGKQLRAAYGELLNTPVPDRINDLINQLKDAESRQGSRKERDGEGSE
jgi:Anti-sigma factor NepR